MNKSNKFNIISGFVGRKVEIKEFQFELLKKQFSLKDAGIAPGLFTFWRKNGLIDFVDDHKWAKLSFLQLIWVKMLVSLREFGISLEKLKRVHDHFFTRAYRDEFATLCFREMALKLEENIKLGLSDTGDSVRLKVIKDSLRNKSLMYIHNRDFNYYSNLLISFLNTRQEVGILIYEDGAIIEYSDNTYYRIDTEESGVTLLEGSFELQAPYIYVSLAYFLLDFIENDSLVGHLQAMDILSEDELDVIQEMRKSNVREIRIQFKDGEVSRIESDVTGNLTADQVKEVKRIIGLSNYERITLDTRDDKTVSFKKTRKILK